MQRSVWNHHSAASTSGTLAIQMAQHIGGTADAAVVLPHATPEPNTGPHRGLSSWCSPSGHLWSVDRQQQQQQLYTHSIMWIGKKRLASGVDREAQCGWGTKINWDKDCSQLTRTHLCVVTRPPKWPITLTGEPLNPTHSITVWLLYMSSWQSSKAGNNSVTGELKYTGTKTAHHTSANAVAWLRVEPALIICHRPTATPEPDSAITGGCH